MDLPQTSGEIPMDYKGIGSFANSGTIQTKLMLDRDTTTYYTSGMAQKAGDWIGVDLRTIRDVSEISILQGRNSVDDVDYFDHAILECSEDGKIWKPLTEELKQQYIIQWQGEAVKARYVRLRRLDSKRTNYASIRSFEVNPLRIEDLRFKLQTENPEQALYAFDKNLGTSFKSKDQDCLEFEVAKGTKAYTLLMNELQTYPIMKQTAYIYLLTLSCLLCACNRENRTNLPQPQVTGVADSLETVPPEEKPKAISAEQIEIKKDLLYDKYTLEDTYPYKDTTRSFQWDKIKERLALLENIQQTPSQWGILQNYKNRNGEAPLVRHYKRNAYKRIADTLGIERYQSVPLYLLTDTLVPERYGEDGSLVRFLADGENFVKVSPIYIGEEWYVPKRYVKVLPDTTHFIKTIMIDRRDQNIMTLEQTGEAQWTVRSMNPATTGRHRPPYAQETPLGIFVLQEKKTRMIFLKDGSTATGGFAPYASRFSDGGYIHGVPVNEPRKALIEYSPSLGTTPRSHMCVRNATSHSKFIFDWAPVNETIIFVLE